MRFIEIKAALKDKAIVKSKSKATREKLIYLVIDILDNPRDKHTVGNPEQLKHTEKELWSRELTKKDRIVYGIEPGENYGMPDEEIIVFYQYLGHYADK